MRAGILVLGTLLALGAATDVRAGGAAELAAHLQDEKAQCGFLLFLCRQANRANQQAADTPAGAEALAFKHDREAELQTHDVFEAADAIAAKYPPGKLPSCFTDPECALLKERR